MKNTFLLLITVLLFNIGLQAQPLQTVNFSSVADTHAYLDPRDGNKKELISAHRGGPYPGYPENCIQTFEHILKYTPAIIELDVSTSKDSVLVMMHDDTLERTTTGNGRVDQHTWKQLKKLKLKDNEGNLTNFRIPKYKKVISWTKGRALLTVDVKKGVPFQKVIQEIERQKATPYTAIITYTLDDALLVHRLNPELLISITIESKEDLQKVLLAGIPAKNIIAFTGLDAKPASFYQLLHAEGIPCISATFRTADLLKEVPEQQQAYQQLWKDGVDIIATDLPIEAAQSH